MLQQIRDRTSGLVAGFIVAMLVVPFAFFGIEGFQGGGGDPVVAKVGDQKIHDSQFRRQFDQRYQQLVQLMGENFRADMFDQKRLRTSVLNDMTQETMLRQYTEAEGYVADDATLFKTISAEQAFQRDGKFNTEAYREALDRVGLTPDRYESQLRDSVEMNQMRSAIVDTAFSADVEVQQMMRLMNETRTLQYAMFELARFRDRVTVTDEQVQARYDETKAQYMAPERIKLAYVELALDSLPEAAAPADDVLKVLYEAEKAGRFTTQEERKASHILISLGADKDAAKAEAEGIAKQLAAGGDFAKLAAEHSDDPGSKGAGGDLGWVRRGQMVKAFEDSLFGLKEKQISEPVESEFGWHIIKLDALKASTVRSLDEPEVRQELTTLFQNRERQTRFQEKSDQLEQLAFENTASLDPVAEALQLKVETTDWFVRGGQGTGIAANPAVVAAAFSTEVLKDGENSKPLAIGDNRIAVVRKAEYEAPRQKSLDEVKDVVRSALVDEAARKLIAQEASEVLNAVRGGTDFQEIISAKGAELRNPGAIRRDDKSVVGKVLSAAFKLARPAEGKVTYGETELDDGGRAVIAFSAVESPGLPSTLVEAQRNRLKQLAAGAEFNAYMKQIEGEVGIELMLPDEDAAPVSPES